jgi:hypothetical protein
MDIETPAALTPENILFHQPTIVLKKRKNEAKNKETFLRATLAKQTSNNPPKTKSVLRTLKDFFC